VNDVVVVGLSYRTAPVEIRERVSTTMSDLAAEVESVRAAGADEAVLLSTCNRVELYLSGSSGREVARRARDHLTARAGVALDPVLYEHHGNEAVRHAFRVASSLDSLVVGEPQILGQVKSSFEAAQSVGAVGTLLDRCFTRAFAVAKRVRNETGIAEGTVSISSIAVDLARSIFGDLSGRRVLLLGAGEMGEAAAKSLAQSGASLRVVNRSYERAHALALACGGEARDYELLPTELVKADVVISSTSNPHFVLTDELVRDVVRGRRHRPLFLIDIAVPRDIDPRVANLDGVFLYDVDDLQKVAEENLRARRGEAEAAERIVGAEVDDFDLWRRSLELAPTIVALRERYLDVVRSEVERTAPRLGSLDDDQRRALSKMADAIVNKLLHAPLAELKSPSDEREQERLLAATRRLFRLDGFAVDASARAAEADPQPVTDSVPKPTSLPPSGLAKSASGDHR